MASSVGDAGPITHQQGHLRLPDAEDCAGLRLGDLTRLDDAVDLQRQTRLEQFLFRVGKTRVSCRGGRVSAQTTAGVSEIPPEAGCENSQKSNRLAWCSESPGVSTNM
jgi:hypothetical protein